MNDAAVFTAHFFDIRKYPNYYDPLVLFEINGVPDIHDHFKHGQDTYVVGMIDHENKKFGVRRIEIKKYATSGTEVMKCPWCGHYEHDAWELSSDEDEHACGNCGQLYKYERHREITYSTSRVNSGKKAAILV